MTVMTVEILSNRLHGEKVGNRKWTEAEKQQLTELWNADVPTAEIAKTFGRSKDAVCSQTLRLGLKMRKPGRQRETHTFRSRLIASDYTSDIFAGEKRFRRECVESNRLYCEAVEAAGGGSWSGVVTPNAAGSTR